MRGLQTLVLLAAVLVYSVESRERLGKVIHKRQARHRDFRTLNNDASLQQQAVVPQAVMTGSFGKDEAALPQAFTDTQGRQSPQRVNVVLGSAPQAQQQQNFQQQAAPLNQQNTLFNARPVAPQVFQQPQAAPLNQNTLFNARPVAQQSYQQPQAAAFNQQPQPAAFNQQPQAAAFNQQPQPAAFNQQPQPIAFNQQPQPAALSQQSQYRPRPVAQTQPQYQSPQLQQQQQIVDQVLRNQPANAQLVAVRQSGRRIPLAERLISNATLIRPNIVDGFSCQGRPYGYYADTLNECQIFHVCYPLRSVFLNDPRVPDATYDFSFICNEFTRFSQDSMTCAWQFEAVPCEYAEQLYSVNDAFFKTTTAPPIGAPGPVGGYQLP